MDVHNLLEKSLITSKLAVVRTYCMRWYSDSKYIEEFTFDYYSYAQIGIMCEEIIDKQSITNKDEFREHFEFMINNPMLYQYYTRDSKYRIDMRIDNDIIIKVKEDLKIYIGSGYLLEATFITVDEFDQLVDFETHPKQSVDSECIEICKYVVTIKTETYKAITKRIVVSKSTHDMDKIRQLLAHMEIIKNVKSHSDVATIFAYYDKLSSMNVKSVN